LRNHSLLINE